MAVFLDSGKGATPGTARCHGRQQFQCHTGSMESVAVSGGKASGQPPT